MITDSTTIVVLCDRNLLPNFVKSSDLNIVYKQVKEPYESSIDEIRIIRDEIESLLLQLANKEALLDIPQISHSC